MKTTLVVSILFCAIALPVFGELTTQDLEKIREIVKDSENELKAKIEKTNEKIDKLEERLRTVETDVATIKGYQTGEQTTTETRTNSIVAIAAAISTAIAILALIANAFRKDPQLETFSRVIENLATSRTAEKTTQPEGENTDTTSVSQQA